ncbi:DPP10 peptidase, partial [Acromyrmex heyeri]
MNASVNVERNSWRLPPDETVQVADPRSKSAQDLTYADGGHNWRSIIFSLLVIGFVIAGIVTAIYLLGYVDELLYWSGRRLTLDECLRDDLTPHRLPPTWITHEKFVYQADDGSLTLLDTRKNVVSLLVSNHTLDREYNLYPLLKVSFVQTIGKPAEFCLAAHCETKTEPHIKWNPEHPTVYSGLQARAG